MKIFLLVIGIAFVVSVLVSRVLAYQTARHFPPTGSFAEIEGARVHYVDTGGEGDLLPVVFIHGASGNLRDLEAPLADILKGRGRMIFVDRPGHGHSERGSAPDMHLPWGQARVISGLLEHLNIESAILVGHSYGGGVAASFAVNHPQQTAGLVFLGPATHPWPGGDVTWHYDVTNTPILGWLFSETLAIPLAHLVFENGVKSVFTPEKMPVDYLLKTGVKLLLRPDVFRYNAKDVGSLYKAVQEISPLYSQIKVPTSIITGDMDDVVLANIHSTGLEKDIEGAKLIWLEGVGHSPAWSAPDVVIGEIERISALAKMGR